MRGQVQVDTICVGDACMDRRGEVGRQVGFANRPTQDLAHFLFHGAAVRGGAHPQSVLEAVVQIADRDGCYGSLPRRWTLTALYVQQSSQSMDALG